MPKHLTCVTYSTWQHISSPASERDRQSLFGSERVMLCANLIRH